MRSTTEFQPELQNEGRQDGEGVDICVPAPVQQGWSTDEALNQEALRVRRVAFEYRGNFVGDRSRVDGETIVDNHPVKKLLCFLGSLGAIQNYVMEFNTYSGLLIRI